MKKPHVLYHNPEIKDKPYQQKLAKDQVTKLSDLANAPWFLRAQGEIINSLQSNGKQKGFISLLVPHCCFCCGEELFDACWENIEWDNLEFVMHPDIRATAKDEFSKNNSLSSIAAILENASEIYSRENDEYIAKDADQYRIVLGQIVSQFMCWMEAGLCVLF